MSFNEFKVTRCYSLVRIYRCIWWLEAKKLQVSSDDFVVWLILWRLRLRGLKATIYERKIPIWREWQWGCQDEGAVRSGLRIRLPCSESRHYCNTSYDIISAGANWRQKQSSDCLRANRLLHPSIVSAILWVWGQASRHRQVIRRNVFRIGIPAAWRDIDTAKASWVQSRRKDRDPINNTFQGNGGNWGSH